MKKKFKLEDLDCANCATKMEEAIKKIPGVNDAVVSFMTQKMTIDAEDERFEEIMDEVAKTCAKVEPDCRILRQEIAYDKESEKMLERILVTGVLFVALLVLEHVGILEQITQPVLIFIIYLVPYLLIGYDIILKRSGISVMDRYLMRTF